MLCTPVKGYKNNMLRYYQRTFTYQEMAAWTQVT